MQVEATRTNLVIIASMGLAMFLIGLFLYVNASRVAPYMRYLLPIPPIAVAAYKYLGKFNCVLFGSRGSGGAEEAGEER